MAASASTAVVDLSQFQGRSRFATGQVRTLVAAGRLNGPASRSSYRGATEPGSGQGLSRSIMNAARMLPPETDEKVSTRERTPSSFSRRSAPR
jgi:hypothetical protein